MFSVFRFRFVKCNLVKVLVIQTLTLFVVQPQHVSKLQGVVDLYVLVGRVGLVDHRVEVVLDESVVGRREVAVKGSASFHRGQTIRTRYVSK